MSTPDRKSLRALVLAADAVALLASMIIAAGLQPALREWLPALKDPVSLHALSLIGYVALPTWLALLRLAGLHSVFEVNMTRWRIAAKLLRVEAYGVTFLSVLLFLGQFRVNRSIIALFVSSSFVLLYGTRTVIYYWVRDQHRRGLSRERLLLVGTESSQLSEFARTASISPFPPELVGRIGPGGGGTLEHLGALEALPEVLHERAVDRVLFFPPYQAPGLAAEAVAHCEAIGVEPIFVVQEGLAGEKPSVSERYGWLFVDYGAAPRPPLQLAVKTMIDVVTAAIGVVLGSPILLAAGLAILLRMGRPIVVLQERVGLRGRRFKMIKFRTMVADAEAKKAALMAQNEMSGPVFKVTDDPRVTPLGRFLRKSSIDELPQLFNVLRGEMSLVGSRPLPVSEQQQIRGSQRRRLSMKPGITGLWQISGRNDIDFDEWMALDLRYIDEWSLSRDIAIILKTPGAVIRRKGAK